LNSLLYSDLLKREIIPIGEIGRKLPSNKEDVERDPTTVDKQENVQHLLVYLHEGVRRLSRLLFDSKLSIIPKVDYSLLQVANPSQDS
jgi:hypothetical protein